jgi:hypothetical protein
MGKCGGWTTPFLLLLRFLCTNEGLKEPMMYIQTNVIRCWITGLIYSREERGEVPCI